VLEFAADYYQRLDIASSSIACQHKLHCDRWPSVVVRVSRRWTAEERRCRSQSLRQYAP
jgi:hypothetical protein